MKADLLQFGSLVTWWWLPSLGSQLLLNACYSLQILSPPPSSAVRTRNNHLQLARTVVIVGTLFYQLYQAAATAQPNHYQLLGLPLDVDAEGVKRSFRALARKYHPDKVGEQGEAFFIVLRRAHDALSDPVKRFAYDRFGPSIAEWKDCESTRDFMRRGLTSLVAFYTINPAMYALFGYISSSGTRSDGLSFWRLACLFSLLAFELCLLVSPDYPTWMTLLMPNTTIFDVRQLSHSLFVNFFFASLQLSAALDVLEYCEEGAPARDKRSKAALAERQMATVRMKAQSLDQAAQVIRVEMMRSFARELRPFRGEAGEQKGEKEREMSVDEEKLFEQIDAVLLSKSLVQANAQLAVLAERPTGATIVKTEQADASAAKPITVKQERQDDASQDKGAAYQTEEATGPAEDSTSHPVIKEEPKDDSFSIITSGKAGLTESILAASVADTAEPETWVQLGAASTGPATPVNRTPLDAAAPMPSMDHGKAPEASETVSATVPATSSDVTTPVTLMSEVSHGDAAAAASRED